MSFSKYLSIAIMSLCSNVFAIVPYGYHSIGIDTYADGTTVNDNECYALVWSKADFAGVDRAGNRINSEDEVLYVRELALNGRCLPVNFLISDDFYNTHSNGSYSVIVLDTRGANGMSYGIDSNQRLSRVNGWEYANVRKDIEANQIATVISRSAKIPDDAKIPKITSFNLDQNGNSIVDFIDSETYLSYKLTFSDDIYHICKYESIDKTDGCNQTNTLVLSRNEIQQMKTILIKVQAINFVY